MNVVFQLNMLEYPGSLAVQQTMNRIDSLAVPTMKASTPATIFALTVALFLGSAAVVRSQPADYA
ncbi:MAG: hypothetical protein ACREE6_14200, partial [Limisphaerales bacterium]